MKSAVSDSSTDSEPEEVVDMALKTKKTRKKKEMGLTAAATAKQQEEKELALARIYNWKPLSAQTLAARFSSDDRYIAYGSADGCVRVLSVSDAFDIETSTAETSTFRASAGGMPVINMRFNPGMLERASETLLVATADSGLQQWNVKTGAKVWQGAVREDDEVNTVEYQMAGTTFAAAGKDRVVRVYDERTKQVTTELHAHENRIRGLKYSPHSQATLVSGGFDGVYIWDVRSPNKRPANLGGVVRITGDALDVYDHHLLTAALPVPGRDSTPALGRLLLWDLRTGKPFADVPWEDAEGELATSLNAAQVCASRANHPM